MIVLMCEDLTLMGKPPEDKNILPEGWFYEDDLSVFHEGELDCHGIGNSKARWIDSPSDMTDDGILEEFKQLLRVGVRGEIHLADSCEQTYSRYILTDKGLLLQTGEIRWTSKCSTVAHD